MSPRMARLRDGIHIVRQDGSGGGSQSERNAEIVALREREFLGYRAIAERYGITRERVRQILRDTAPEKPWLRGFAWGPKRRVTMTCKGCGKQMLDQQRSDTERYCSHRCAGRHKHRDTRARWIAFVKDEVAPLRLAGRTWAEIGEIGETNPFYVCVRSRKYAREAGLTKAQIAIIWPGMGKGASYLPGTEKRRLAGLKTSATRAARKYEPGRSLSIP